MTTLLTDKPIFKFKIMENGFKALEVKIDGVVKLFEQRFKTNDRDHGTFGDVLETIKVQISELNKSHDKRIMVIEHKLYIVAGAALVIAGIFSFFVPTIHRFLEKDLIAYISNIF